MFGSSQPSRPCASCRGGRAACFVQTLRSLHFAGSPPFGVAGFCPLPKPKARISGSFGQKVGEMYDFDLRAENTAFSGTKRRFCTIFQGPLTPSRSPFPHLRTNGSKKPQVSASPFSSSRAAKTEYYPALRSKLVQYPHFPPETGQKTALRTRRTDEKGS